jgi:hypothetical protein
VEQVAFNASAYIEHIEYVPEDEDDDDGGD